MRCLWEFFFGTRKTKNRIIWRTTNCPRGFDGDFELENDEIEEKKVEEFLEGFLGLAGIERKRKKRRVAESRKLGFLGRKCAKNGKSGRGRHRKKSGNREHTGKNNTGKRSIVWNCQSKLS